MIHRSVGREYPLEWLLQDIHGKVIAQPDWRSGYTWSEEDALGLLDSLYNGCPIGSHVLWREGAASEKRSMFPTMRDPATELLVVDGLQRLWTLYAAVLGVPFLGWRNGGPAEIELNVAFRPRDGLFRMANDQVVQDPEYVPAISAFWREHESLQAAADAFLERLRSDREVLPEVEEALTSALGALWAVPKSSIHVYELDPSCEAEDAIDVWLRVNRHWAREPQSQPRWRLLGSAR